jgi:hypothetical protein
MATTSWLIGSIENLAAQSWSFGGAPSTAIAAGDYYLIDEVAAVSMLRQLELTLSAVLGATAEFAILENRLIKITSDGGNFGISWDSTELRDLLGFIGNVSGADNYTASLISPLLWSPGRTETPLNAPLGDAGQVIHDTMVGASAGAVQMATSNNSVTHLDLMWRYVTNARTKTSARLGGEYHTFWEDVIRHLYKYKLYREIDEDTSGSDPILWPAVTWSNFDVLGPMELRHEGGQMAWEYIREEGLERCDSMHPITLRSKVVPEYT